MHSKPHEAKRKCPRRASLPIISPKESPTVRYLERILAELPRIQYDLAGASHGSFPTGGNFSHVAWTDSHRWRLGYSVPGFRRIHAERRSRITRHPPARSEEHTSELQSPL